MAAVRDLFSARLQRCRRSEEHTSELQSQSNLVCRLLLEKKKMRVRDRSGEIRNLQGTEIPALSRYVTPAAHLSRVRREAGLALAGTLLTPRRLCHHSAL